MKKLVESMQAFHRDEEGAPEMSTVLIIALIVVPMVVAIVFFGRMIMEWFTTSGEAMRTDGDDSLNGTGF